MVPGCFFRFRRGLEIWLQSALVNAYDRMTVSLDIPWYRIAFGSAVLGLAGAVSYSAGIFWLASSYGISTNPQEIGRAIALEPDNAQHHHRLGHMLQNSLLGENLQEGIEHYRRATQLNPRSARYWMDLAVAYEQAGRATEAGQAFENAKASYPMSAEVAWNYGNFLVRREELSLGFAEIKHALALDPRLAPLAVSVSWRVTSDPERILAEVLPRGSRFYYAAMQYFVSRQELDPALTAWRGLLDLKEPLELQRVFPLLDRLTQQDRIDDAIEVWQQALQAAGRDQWHPAEHSLVWNGGFEYDLLRGGFGWRQHRIAGATFDFDTTTYRSGARSLQIRFDGTANMDFQHLVQYVPVRPRNRYRFAGFLRTEGISTDSGIRFRIFDPKRRAALDILTPGLVGSEPWVLQEAEITTGSETRLLAIALRRLPSRKFDNKLRGTVWVDDVSLTAVSTPARRQTQ